jgi:sugar transferase (PEP-CTERM/EpsH1 system associated)
VLKHLAKRAEVWVACLADEPVSEQTIATLRSLAKKLAIIPTRPWRRWPRALLSFLCGRTISEGAFASAPFSRILARWASDTKFHVSLASSSSLAPYLRLPALRDTRAIIDLVDVDSQKWFDYAASTRGLRSWLFRTEARRLRRLEQELCSRADAGTVVSQVEAEVFRSFCAWEGLHVLPNGVDFDYFRPPSCPPAEQGCVFVGALDYYPNVDAACWFCREIWPRIHRRFSEAHLQLVGRRPVAAVRKLAEVEGVEVVGPVADVRPYLAKAAVAIAPLRIARGVQNKVLEALAMAKATVATPQALAGFPDDADIPALRASSSAEWTVAVTRLLGDAQLRRDLGASGRRYVESHHDWDRCLASLDEWLDLEKASAPLHAS